MKNYKLTWGGKKNTKVLKLAQESGPGQGGDGTGVGQTGGTGGSSGGGTTTATYVEPTGNTQSYPINQVLVTPGNLTAWGSLTINWINSPTQQQTQEVDSLTDWMNEQQNSDFI
jgi:hypothetical protein